MLPSLDRLFCKGFWWSGWNE